MKTTILLPCLNEEKTLLSCIQKIQKTMNKSKYKKDYEILICDNNSTDHSISICKKNKIPYTICKEKGYGATLRNGINKSKSDYIVMLDCDESYDETDIPKMIDKLEEGYDFVIGNRFKGTIEKKAMPLSHSIGSRILTEYANVLFHTKSHDYHCGLRAFKRKEILKCDLNTKGFEFASEMVIKAKIKKLKMYEMSTNLFEDKRDRKPHLKTIRDGFRHLHLINTLKFQKSIVFRYLTTFIGMILVLIILQLGSQIIPTKWVQKNVIQSAEELSIQFQKSDKDQKKVPKEYEKYEKYGDMRNLAMIYLEDNRHPLKSMIEMNYYKNCDFNLVKCSETLKNNHGEIIDYSRYWHGQTIIEKLLLIVMSIQTINKVNLVFLIVLLLLTCYRLWKKDKKFSIAFFLSSISINIFFMTTSVQYITIIFLTFIFINVLLTLLEKKSNNIDLLFLISGMLTCYFDFLTCETITLTIPLIVYIYFQRKNNNSITMKEILKIIVLWGIGYIGAFIIKWLLACLHYGFSFANNISRKANIRMSLKGRNNLLLSIEAIGKSLSYFLPFTYLKHPTLVILIIGAVTFLYELWTNRKNTLYYLIVLIPLARYIVLVSHSYFLSYFTYRAFWCLILIAFLALYDIITVIIGVNKNEE